MAINPYQPPSRPPADAVADEGRDAVVAGGGDVKHSLECVQFVRRALALARKDRDLSPEGVADAVGVCRVALELACDLYGQAGKQKLIDWGIVTSKDIGTIVYRLADAGFVITAEDDSQDDFAGLFDLTLPPESWKLQW